MPPLPENNQQIYADPDLGDAELQQWLTSVGDGADITLPGLDIGLPTGVRDINAGIARVDKTVTDQLPNGQTGEDDLDDDESDDDEPSDETPTTDPATPSSATPEFIEVNGQQIPKADIQRLYEFDKFLRANPDAAQRVQAAIPPPAAAPPAGGPPNVPTPPTPANQVEEWKDPEPPDFLDLDDPAQKFQWDTHVSTQKALFDRDQRDKQLFAQQAQDRQAQTTRQAAVDMGTALEQFKQAHPNLNEDDIATIRKSAGPFVSGMLAQLPPVQALVRSMEVGGMMDDDMRTKLTDPTIRTQSEKTKTRHRKARLGELSGSPRSAPKTEARPQFTSDKDFVNAIAQELSESMNR